MTQADFYVLGKQAQHDQWYFACRLVEQIQQKGHQVLLQVSNEEEAKALDDMLWQFRPDAFVPHALLNAKDAPVDCPVSIGWHQEPGHHHDVIIILTPELPAFYGRFQRLVEVVVQNDDVLEYTRQHFRFLKDRGYPIDHKHMRMS
jgi:DNA polymerase-3 subunit chi